MPALFKRTTFDNGAEATAALAVVAAAAAAAAASLSFVPCVTRLAARGLGGGGRAENRFSVVKVEATVAEGTMESQKPRG